MKNVLNIANLIAEKFPKLHIPLINGIEKFDSSFSDLVGLSFFSESDFNQKILECLDRASIYRKYNLLDFENILDGIDLNVGVYSKYFNEYFNSELEYNNYVRESDVDFINLIKYENIEYYVQKSSDYSVDFNDLFYFRAETEREVQKKIEEFNNNLDELKKSYRILEDTINDIIDNYNIYNEGDGDLIPEYSFNALSVLKEYDYSNYFELINALKYQEELIKKIEFNNKLNDTLKEKGTSKKVNKL